MTAHISRYLIENHGPDAEAVRTAFTEAYAICDRERIYDVHLLVPTKGAFSDTVVGTFLGASVYRDLCAGNRVRITKTLTMSLSSLKTFQRHGSYGMLLGVYLSANGQDVLDSVTNARAVVLLPWTEEEGKRWMATWRPTTIGPRTWQSPSTQLHAEVEANLAQLTARINLSTGLLHPSDRRTAEETFVRMKKLGYRPEAETIRQWAVRNNWSPKHAAELAKMAARYFG